MTANFTFTSESVSEGHPDKMADQISDAILDAILAEDPMARVACETMVTTGMAIVSGEITTSAYVEIPDIVRKTINAIGYDRESMGFDGNTCGVMTTIDPQSPDIAQGVDKAFETRVGERSDELDDQADGKHQPGQPADPGDDADQQLAVVGCEQCCPEGVEADGAGQGVPAEGPQSCGDPDEGDDHADQAGDGVQKATDHGVTSATRAVAAPCPCSCPIPTSCRNTV